MHDDRPPRPALELPAPLAAFDARHGLWLADARYLRRLDLEAGRVQRLGKALDLDAPRALAVAPDASQLVLADRERCLQVIDPLADAPEHADLFVTGIAEVAYSPDGHWLALAHSDEGLLLVDAATMEPAWASEFIASQQPVVRFSSDASLVAVNTCEAVIVFDTATGEQRARVEPQDAALFTWATDADLRRFVLAIDCGATLLTATRDAEVPEAGELDYEIEPLVEVEDRLLALDHAGPTDQLLGVSATGALCVVEATGQRAIATTSDAARRVDVGPEGQTVLVSRADGNHSHLVRLVGTT